MEDLVKVETGFGKGLLGFVFQKFLEGKFGVKFVNFSVHNFNVSSLADERNLHFDIAINGEISKGDVINIIQGGEK